MIFNMVDNGGGSVAITPLSVNTNGTYTAPTGTAYSPVTVNVSGGGGEAEEKDVNFYDYDGTRVYSYTKADFLALAAMPSNPNHSTDTIPLTSQGWNWTLADAKTYVTAYGMLDIGQMYTPTDGKTHIVIKLTDKNRLAPRLGLAVNGTVTVDWGDGNTDTVSATSMTSQTRKSHTYAAPGTYDITVTKVSGSYGLIGTSSYTLLSAGNSTYNYNRVYASCVQAVHTASDCRFRDYALNGCYGLTTLTIASGDTTLIGQYGMRYCGALKTIILPSTVTSISSYAFQYCYSTQKILIPRSVTTVGSQVFRYNYILKTIRLPNTVTNVGSYAFAACNALADVTLPSGVTSIGSNAFDTCASLPSITIPATVTSIAASAFYSCYGCARFYIKATTPPTLANTNAFSNTDSNSKIVVPDASVDTYKGASNWSSYASRIIGESDDV